MATISFNVLESSDAGSFTITNTGDDVATDPITLTVTDPEGDDYTFSIAGTDLTAFNSADGLEVTTTDLSYSGDFEDGIYVFTLNDGVDDSEITEGFAAVITDSVMTESLAYRVYETKAQKDYINEKMRLLNNLAYSASVGSTDKFTENLEILQRME